MDGAPIRHFYHQAAPSPDTLFRATAPVLLADCARAHVGRWSPAAKEAALASLAAGGFLLLDSAQCPVNHLADAAARRRVARACAGEVLRAQLAALRLAPEARICLVVRSTVPQATVPLLEELGLMDRVVDRRGLPFPGRWTGHRAAFQAGLATAAALAGWCAFCQEPGAKSQEPPSSQEPGA
jgi:hypothetical protein